ncbi:virulence-related protein [Clostridium butyricum]|uniref:virulence-related protein n=1 Tax=Clostridium butyricum TaxID=1492 RepID=UPI00129ADF29|nr:virulence-related protein [Clostridium butyricum]QGH20220.1 virulence-related protein [Clostridium butyricum]QGH24255.1 virulence-related protein [Clostridium butyricum]
MDKKEILKALGEYFGVKPNYLGAPSFAYQIINNQGELLIVDREGKIKDNSGLELEIGTILRGAEVHFKTEESLNSQVILTMDGHTGNTLRNLVNMISSKQGLIKKALGIEKDIVTDEFVEKINSVRLTTIEDFEAEALNIGLEKGGGLGFDFNKKSISFEFLNGLEDEGIKKQFAEALNEGAIKLKHTSYKEKKTDNEKFTMRTWLLRLGFIGDRYKEARNQLLRNLSGNSAFRRQEI